MSLVEVLPNVQSLSRQDKLRLIKLLAGDLANEERDLIPAGQSYPVWSPESAFAAASTLMRVLEDERNQT